MLPKLSCRGMIGKIDEYTFFMALKISIKVIPFLKKSYETGGLGCCC